MAVVVMLVGLTSSGCSWWLQSRLPGGLDGYQVSAEPPRCSTSKGWPVLDGVFAGLQLVSLAVVATDTEPIENRNAVIIGNIAWAIVHTASALTGARGVDECRQAYDEWAAVNSGGRDQERRRLALELAGNPWNDPRRARAFWCAAGSGDCVVDETACIEGSCSRSETAWCAVGKRGFVCQKTVAGCSAVRYGRRAWNLTECVERRPGLLHVPPEQPGSAPPAAGPDPSTPPASPAPRGFHCASSAARPAAGFCTRETADCQRARDAALASVTDLGECQIVEAAFCYAAPSGERCAPTMEACAEQAGSVPGGTGACEERK
jgi:hypothetical protein